MVLGKKQLRLLCVVVMIFIVAAFISNWVLKEKMNVIAAPSKTETIVIDAGHGGFDGGAVGYNGIIEKDINLAIAQNLKQLLLISGFNVVMTRDSDVALCDGSTDEVAAVTMKKTDMRRRLKIMDETKNSITVSIHQNKFEQQSPHGAQMFYGVNNPLSKTLAECIQGKFVENLQKDNTRQIKMAQKDLFLLYYTKSPAVIVECGFISNPEEAGLLANKEYQKKVALTIFEGITEFLKK